jgi:hypothetical protein
MSNYQDQWERTKRWFERIKEIENGQREELNLPRFKDEYMAFFINCYHLADYIEKDDNLNISGNAIYNHIRSSQELKICKDVANASKHLKLNSCAETTQNTDLAEGIDVELNLPSGEASISYKIEMQNGEKDAFSVAQDCISDWKDFFQKHNLN